MRNIALLEKVHEQITKHPETHDQHLYETKGFDKNGNECGTAHCVAGHAVVLTTGKPFYEGLAELRRTTSMGEGASEIARHLLGISYEVADRLFSASLDEDLAVGAVRMLAAGQPEDEVIEHLGEPWDDED